MNLFLDSNVVLGYIFNIDSLFEPSRKYIFNSKNNFYSNNVKNEVNTVFSRKSFEFTNFLIKLNKILDEFKDISFTSDEEILFDAHEFAKNNKKLDLKFVTADQKFFEAITILKKYLSFGDCINLMEFSSN